MEKTLGSDQQYIHEHERRIVPQKHTENDGVVWQECKTAQQQRANHRHANEMREPPFLWQRRVKEHRWDFAQHVTEYLCGQTRARHNHFGVAVLGVFAKCISDRFVDEGAATWNFPPLPPGAHKHMAYSGGMG